MEYKSHLTGSDKKYGRRREAPAAIYAKASRAGRAEGLYFNRSIFLVRLNSPASRRYR